MKEKKRRTQRRSTKPSQDYSQTLLKAEEDALKKALHASLKKKLEPTEAQQPISLRKRFTQRLKNSSEDKSNTSKLLVKSNSPSENKNKKSTLLVKQRENMKDTEIAIGQNRKRKKKKLETEDPDFICDLKTIEVGDVNLEDRGKRRTILKQEQVEKVAILPGKKRRKIVIKKKNIQEEDKPKIRKRKAKLQLPEVNEGNGRKNQPQDCDHHAEPSPPKRKKKKVKTVQPDNEESDTSIKEENESISSESSRTKTEKERFGKLLQAQRKFAHSQPCSSSSLLLKQISTPLTERPKTEDFITFLCLRGTPALPEELKFFDNPCLPPSPLSSDDEDSLPVSPFFKRQNGTPSQEIQPSLNFAQQLSFHEPVDDFCQTPARHESKELVDKMNGSGSTVGSVVSPSPDPSPASKISLIDIKVTKKKKSSDNTNRSPTDTHVPAKRPTNLNLTNSVSPNVSRASPSVISKTPPIQFVAAVDSPILSSKEIEPSGRKRKRRSLDFHDIQTNAKTPVSDEKEFTRSSKTKADMTNKRSPSVKELSPPESSKPSLDLSDTSSQDTQPCSKRREAPGKATHAAALGKGKKAQAKLKVLEQNIFEENIYSSPVFKPMEIEFKDPAKYIKKITPYVLKFGICVVVPPAGWRPSSNISDDVRFNTKVQHIHRFKNRYPPSTRQLNAIKECLQEKSVPFDVIPQIGCCEVDLPHISRTMKDVGGVQKVNSIKKWQKFADALNIPKNAQGRLNRLQDVYYKCLLPYDLLSKENKDRLNKVVDKNAKENPDCQEDIEYKGKSSSLVQFHRIALNAQEMYGKGCNNVNALETEFWDVVEKGDRHIATLSGEVDTTKCGPSFQVGKSKSGWNLSALPLINGSALKPLGQLPGVTTPWLRFDSIYSTTGWRKRPNAFYMVEYLHAESSKIWYAVPAYMEQHFTQQMKNLVPDLANDDEEEDWLRKCLVSPLSLMENKCSVVRAVQNEGQFVVVLPNVYHCIVNTGYCCSEAVQYVSASWLMPDPSTGLTLNVSDLKFPIEKIILQSAKEEIVKAKSSEYLPGLLKRLYDLRDEEVKVQQTLLDAGLRTVTAEIGSSMRTLQSGKPKRAIIDWEICEKCDKLCYLSLVKDDENDCVYCLEHTLELIESGIDIERLSIVRRMTQDDLDELIQKIEQCVKELENKDNAVEEKEKVGKVIRKRRPKTVRECKDKNGENSGNKRGRGCPRASDKEQNKVDSTVNDSNKLENSRLNITKSKNPSRSTERTRSRTVSPEFDDDRNIFTTIKDTIDGKSTS